MSELRIRVGAALDADTSNVFMPVIEAARRARLAIQYELNAGATAGREALEREAKREVAILERTGAAGKQVAKARATAEISEAKRSEREQEASAARLTRDLEREASNRTANEVREARRASAELARLEQADGRRGGGRGFWSRTKTSVGSMLNMGTRVAADIARGAGVNIDVGSMVSSYVSRQKLSTDIANSGFIEGAAGPAGQRVAASDIQAQATTIAKSTGGSSTEILEGLQKFVSFTGDLKTGRDVLADMAKLAVATGSSMEDVVGSAGKISKNLGDVPDKAEQINAVMLKLAGMGKIGAVEMRDFAAELSKIAPMANRFGGDKAANLGKMGVLMQLAQSGGAKGASQAGTAAVRFVETFASAPNIKAWGKEGFRKEDIFDAHGALRDPRTLLLEALNQTKGDQVRIGSLFKSKPAKQVIEPMLEAYNAKGGGAAGANAAADVYDQLAKAGMSLAERDRELAEEMQTAKNKVERFNSQLEEIADKTITKVLPAFERLAPVIEMAAKTVGDLISAAAEYPKLAIAVAAAASMGGITQIAVATLIVGKMSIDEFFDKKDKDQRDDISAELTEGNLAGQIKVQGYATPEQEKELEAQLATLKGRTETAGKNVGKHDWWLDDPSLQAGLRIAKAFGVDTGSAVTSDRTKDEQRSYDALLKATEQTNRLLERIHNNGIPVHPKTPVQVPVGGIAPSTATAGPNPQHR